MCRALAWEGLMRKALGIDVASSTWASNGSALITFDSESVRAIKTPAIEWPIATRLTPAALADAIDTFALAKSVVAISLDGPQGWRDPSRPTSSPGVGRRCEYECRTQGKTGVFRTAYPSTQLVWI